MKGEKWFERPMRIAAMQSNQGENTFKIPEIISGAGFNVEQLLHLVGRQSMGLFEKERDLENLNLYLEKSRALGIKVILYFNAHMMERFTFAENPGWAQRNPDNGPVSMYGSYILTCVNSSWRDSFLATVSDALDCGIDGIFLDGPLFANDGCYCDECRKYFKEKYGYEMEQATYSDLMNHKTGSIVSFIRDVREVIGKRGRDIILYANSPVLGVNITGCDVEAIYPYVDLIGTEGGFIFYANPNDISIWRGSRAAKYLESKAKGKPTVIFSDGAHKSWARYMHTPAESRLLFASAVANGASVWYGINGPVEDMATPGAKAAFEFNRYLAKHEEYYSDTSRYSDVAIVWSKNTLYTFPDNVYKTDFTDEVSRKADYETGRFLKEFNGFYDIMTRGHIQFDIIDEEYIRETVLDRYKAIILPNVSCLGEIECGIIREYVRNGGTIVSTFAASLYDDGGNRRKLPQLGDVFGISGIEGVVGYDDGCSYMRMGDAAWINRGLSARLTAGYSKSLKCTFKEDTEILAWMYQPMAGRYDAIPAGTYPSIATAAFGKGRSIYISGGLGDTYSSFAVTDMKEIVWNILEKYTDSDIKVENIYESVEVELRSQPEKNRKLIHFVNYTGCMSRPIDRLIPCSNAKVSLRAENVNKVYSLYKRCDIEFKTKGEWIEFVVPSIEEYELVVVELRE